MILPEALFLVPERLSGPIRTTTGFILQSGTKNTATEVDNHWGWDTTIFFFVLYSTLLHLSPLRFQCADGCWDRTQPLQLVHWQSDALTSRLDLIRNTPLYCPVKPMRTTTISPLTSVYYTFLRWKQTAGYMIWERPVPDMSYGYGVHPTLYVNHGWLMDCAVHCG
jgi:hypothetical protein